MTSARCCFHCGEVVPGIAAESVRDGAARCFCCEGCRSAAQWISDAGLDDYYTLRESSGARVTDAQCDYALWDRAELLADQILDREGRREITLLVGGMHCAACAWLLDRALRRTPGVADVSVNAVSGRLWLAWNPDLAQLSVLLTMIARLGYRPCLARGGLAEQAQRRERQRWLLRLGVAGLGAMQTMMFSEALFFVGSGDMPLPTRDFFRWIALLVSLPVVFYSGWPFIQGMLRELRARRMGMDTLIASATLLAFSASVVETLRGGAHVWFDAAVMFVFLLLLARSLERRARDAASVRVDGLSQSRPTVATRERADGSIELVPIGAVTPGDILRVAAGASVPADGRLLDHLARIEESLLTGESRPVERYAGEIVYAGSCSMDGGLRMRVQAVGTATRLAQLARLVGQAEGQRPAIALLADRIASVFVPALLVAALVCGVIWQQYDPTRTIEVVLALLVASCPCALSLAVPAAITVGHGALARLGVLVLRPQAIERLAAATDIVFDKTGTLTSREPTLGEVRCEGELTPARANAIAAALEREAGHPLAALFVDARDVPAASSVRVHAGAGVEGWVDGALWRIGRTDFVSAEAGIVDDDICLGEDGRIHALFQVHEQPRPGAAPAIAALRGLGLEIHLSSGDGAVAVERIAERLSITGALARQSPEQKLATVRALQSTGRRVAMIGDGVNDAPVLAGADVSLALADGASLAHRASDLLLVHTALERIPQAIVQARRIRRVIRQNLGWALGYNLVVLPIAAMGFMTPWMAALGMSISSLLVTLNSLRLRRIRLPLSRPAAPASPSPQRVDLAPSMALLP